MNFLCALIFLGLSSATLVAGLDSETFGLFIVAGIPAAFWGWVHAISFVQTRNLENTPKTHYAFIFAAVVAQVLLASGVLLEMTIMSDMAKIGAIMPAFILGILTYAAMHRKEIRFKELSE